jgi:hypothetical protein
VDAPVRAPPFESSTCLSDESLVESFGNESVIGKRLKLRNTMTAIVTPRE